ncbi:hypothetical protein NIES4071_108510 (plasmid) [Calothrix sp. NIES-4071]|nr:hypothetical protein NIES4071_108510 [Calothrix sp. NIES-4071]BAZ65137.1 hypothetical protein NIES4105_108700 [Calothrix sp. NIES-4105]
MYPIVIPQELNITLDTMQPQPVLENPKVLLYSNVVSSYWEQACSEATKVRNQLRLVINDGGGIIVEPHKIGFQEVIKDKPASKVEIPDIACKYVSLFPNLGIHRLVMNITGHVPIGDNPTAPLEYLHSHFLARGSWLNFGLAPVETAITFRYQLETSFLQMNICHGTMRTPDEEITPIVAFLAEFNHNLVGQTPTEQMQSVTHAISNWQLNLKIYTDLINQRFLATQPAKNKKRRFYLKAS